MSHICRISVHSCSTVHPKTEKVFKTGFSLSSTTDTKTVHRKQMSAENVQLTKLELYMKCQWLLYEQATHGLRWKYMFMDNVHQGSTGYFCFGRKILSSFREQIKIDLTFSV